MTRQIKYINILNIFNNYRMSFEGVPSDLILPMIEAMQFDLMPG